MNQARRNEAHHQRCRESRPPTRRILAGRTILRRRAQSSQNAVSEQHAREHDQRVRPPEVRIEDVHRVQGQRDRCQKSGCAAEEGTQDGKTHAEQKEPREQGGQSIAQGPGSDEIEGEPLQEGQHDVRARHVEGRENLPVRCLAQLDGCGTDGVHEERMVLIPEKGALGDAPHPQDHPQSECQSQQEDFERSDPGVHLWIYPNLRRPGTDPRKARWEPMDLVTARFPEVLLSPMGSSKWKLHLPSITIVLRDISVPESPLRPCGDC